jgi:hypothetical protein
MIAGDRCTRACGFCAVATAKPLALESDEPDRVAEATRRMNLKHVVITAVARDDLPDGGAEHFRQTIERVRALNPGIVIEVLVPDFLDRDESIHSVLRANPHIYNHNLETVRRLTPSVRHRATYDRSLKVLTKVKALRGDSIHTKSGVMLGLGETESELLQAMEDLRGARCDILTLGQYLQPTLRHTKQSANQWDLSTSPAVRWSAVRITRTSSPLSPLESDVFFVNAHRLGGRCSGAFKLIAQGCQPHRGQFRRGAFRKSLDDSQQGISCGIFITGDVDQKCRQQIQPARDVFRCFIGQPDKLLKLVNGQVEALEMFGV